MGKLLHRGRKKPLKRTPSVSFPSCKRNEFDPGIFKRRISKNEANLYVFFFPSRFSFSFFLLLFINARRVVFISFIYNFFND